MTGAVGVNLEELRFKADMRYTELEQLSNPEFKRLCGVSRRTFGEMAEILRPQLDRSGKRGGQAKLSVDDQLLVAME